MAQAANLLNAEQISKSYGTRTLLDGVSLGLGAGDVVGVVGRNGDGKSTLLGILTGAVDPDAGRMTHTGGVSIGMITQAERPQPGVTVRDLIVGGQPDHVWAADARSRKVVADFLAEIDLDAQTTALSGGELRRAALASLLLAEHDLLVLDEPTNHLDVEAVAALSKHLRELQANRVAMLVVSHDRWFLDEICNVIWEVHDAKVDRYEGGYSAYVLARAERMRMAAVSEARRQNLVRKELAWLRRGPPARTSKPKFRIAAANELIADVPEPRDKLELQRFAAARLGKDVIDLFDASVQFGDGSPILDRVTWSIGPGDRIGLIGVNGSGKSTLLNLLAGLRGPHAGKIKHGQTLRLGYLSQHVDELDDSEQVLASVTRLREETKLATGREVSAGSLLEDFGFTGSRLVTRIGELSGGERRRLQFLRLLIAEPNVLLLDEPTNDLDIDTLNVIEDYLDSWPGTLIVASHDRYFLDRVTDVQYALRGDGKVVLLPGGIDQYLAERAASQHATGPSATSATSKADEQGPKVGDAARQRAAKKDLQRLESQLDKAASRIEAIHAKMAEHAADYQKLADLQVELDAELAKQDELEDAWLEAAEQVS